MPRNPVHVCVVGSANMDLTFCAPRLPRPGETLAGHDFRTGFGGKGANQAVMAARLGARVAMVARVGGDLFGKQLVDNLANEGLDVSHVQVDSSRPSGAAAILVDDQAQNCILVVPGANWGLSAADVVHAQASIQSADALLCQLEVPIATTLEAFRLARARSVRTILNPAPAADLPDELLRLTDLCVPNQVELELLTGRPAGTVAECTSAARDLCQRGAGTVIVTLGAAGALVVNDRSVHVPPFPVKAVDPTGAGDAFIGALAVFLAEDCALDEAVRRANAAAALSVTRSGARESFPRRAELAAFLGNME